LGYKRGRWQAGKPDFYDIVKNRPDWGGLSCYAIILATLESVAIEFRFFCFAAFGATLGLILKSLFLVEFLFAFGEDEFFVAVSADNGFVWHGFSYVFSGSNILGLSRNTRKRHLGMLNRFWCHYVLIPIFLSTHFFKKMFYPQN
jgi:hypothetical protein